MHEWTTRVHTHTHRQTHTHVPTHKHRGILPTQSRCRSSRSTGSCRSNSNNRYSHRSLKSSDGWVFSSCPCAYTCGLLGSVCVCDLVIFPCSGGPVCYTTRHLTPIRIITRGRVCVRWWTHLQIGWCEPVQKLLPSLSFSLHLSTHPSPLPGPLEMIPTVSSPGEPPAC